MKKFIVILGIAHADNVAGKCSPDGLHHEPVWSKAQCKLIAASLSAKGINYAIVQPDSDDLKGRVAFVRECEKIASEYEHCLLLSLHNNAAGNGQWMNAHGWCVYDSPGYTNSDVYAQQFFNDLLKALPEIPVRRYSLQKPDFEAAFTVLLGYNYNAVLIEWLFQDNKEDLALIENESICERMRNAIINRIELISKSF